MLKEALQVGEDLAQLVSLGNGRGDASWLSLDDKILHRFLDRLDRGLVEVGQQGIQF